MNIYKISFNAKKFRKLAPVREKELNGDNLWITGKLKKPSWHSPEMEYSIPSDQEKVSDITRISPAFYALNSKAVESLGEFLEKNGEILVLPVGSGILYAFNPNNEIDCLDMTASEWKLNRAGEKSRLIQPVFDQSMLKGMSLFQIPELRSAIFVTESFVEKYINSGLTGLVFEKC